MKARRFEFKEIKMTDEVYNATKGTTETIQQGVFSYREIAKSILNQPGAKGANSTEEVIKSVMLYGRIKEALRKSESSVLLDKEEYDYLLTRLNGFTWAIAHEVVSEFIVYVRTLPEVDLVEAQKPA